jgi:competence protein ComEC
MRTPLGIAATVILMACAALQLPILPPRWLIDRVMLLLLTLLLLWFLRAPGGVPNRRGILFALVATLTLGITLHAGAEWREQLLPDACERESLELQGTIRGLVWRSGEGDNPAQRVDLTVEQLAPAHCAGPLRVRLYIPDTLLPFSGLSNSDIAPNRGAKLRPGDRLRVTASLRRPWGLLNPFAMEGERRYLLSSLHGVGSVQRLQHVPLASDRAAMAKLDRLREDLSLWVRSHAPGETGGLLAALAVGDRRFISSESWARLRLYGLTHLMVISGMHVSLLALPGWWLGSGITRSLALVARPPRIGPWLPVCFAILPAGVYSLLAGLSLPTQRALIMLVCALLPLLFDRSPEPSRLLAICALALFILDPVSLLGASYWLSLMAVALLLWFTAWQAKTSGLRRLAATQGFMLLAMIPAGLYWFGTASTAGGVLNLLAIPLVTLVIVPSLLAAVALSELAPSLAVASLQLSDNVLSTLWHAMAYWEPSLAGNAQFFGSPGLALCMAGVLGLALLALPDFRGRWALLILMCLPLCIPSLPAAVYGRDRAVDILFFDVGQGTAVLVRDGQSLLLYDTGGGPPDGTPVAARSILPLLRARGVRDLDWLVISHPDRDHDAGEQLLSDSFAVRQQRVGRVDREVHDLCRMGEMQALGPSVTLRFLSSALARDSDNNASCVLMLSAHGRRVLLPGDIDNRRERELLAYWGDELRADVLLAAHHGSASSSSRLWLRSVAPMLVVFTAGRSNRFGHPAAAVLDRVRGSGAVPVNTALRGAIRLRIEPGGKLRCIAHRHRWQAFWRHAATDRDCMRHAVPVDGYNQAVQ